MHKDFKIKVAFLLDNKGNRRHHIQIEALAKAGFIPKVIVFKDYPPNGYLLSKGHKEKFIFLNSTREEGFKRFSLRTFSELKKIIQKENIKIILTHRWRLLKYLVLIKLFYPNLKVIFHIVISGIFRSRLRRVLFRIWQNKIDKILVNSKALKEELINLKLAPSSKIDILYSAVDLKEFDISLSKIEARKKLNFPENEFIFGMVARFRKEKDHRGLIYAFKEFINRGGKAKLVLVGDGPEEEKCKKLAKELNLHREVIFTGKLPMTSIPVVLKTFDVFIYATHREGMPMAVLEAMAAGLPIIATDAEGLPDIFDTPLFFGYLVPKRNYEALAEAMWKIYQFSEKERQELGMKAKQRLLENFYSEKLIKNTIDIFKNLISF